MYFLDNDSCPKLKKDHTPGLGGRMDSVTVGGCWEKDRDG